MRLTNQKLLSLLAGLLLTSASTVVLAAALVIPLYHATYSVGIGSLSAGTTRFTLKRNTDGTYTYQSVTEPAGLTALFRSDVITETSRFSTTDGRLVPLLYSYTHTGGDHNQSESIRFQWNKGTAQSDEGSKKHTLPIKAGTYDRLLAQLAISMDLEAGQDVEDYPMLAHNEINVYHMLRQDNTDLKTPAGAYETVVIARRDPHKDRVTTFWLAPKLNYLPVQMEQTEPGKATISLVLTEIEFDTPNSR